MRHFKLVALCLAAAPLPAQYTIQNILFNGATSYTQAALESASGLKPGQVIGTDALQQAAQRLVDTGAFDDLQVTVDGPVKSISVIFKIKPLDPTHQLTVTFDNLIWFTPQELEAGLHSRVPLYSTLLPESGNLQDAVEAALLAMLQEKGITAALTHSVFEPSAERLARVVAYRVKSPAIAVHAVHLNGVTSQFTAAIHESTAKTAGRPFNEGIERTTTADVLLAPYLTTGYLEAQLTGRTLTPIPSTAGRIDVDIDGTVESGELFHLGEIAWAGSPELSTAAFTAASPLHTGDLASTATLARAIDLIAKAYRRDGHNDVLVATNPAIDKASNRVAYTFTVIPGAEYHVRSVTPVNLTTAQQADYARGWRLKPGDIYNPEYIQSFLKQNTALLAFAGYSASFKAVSDPETHLVDVTVIFMRGSGVSAN